MGSGPESRGVRWPAVPDTASACPRCTLCYYTPRISYEAPKTVICACPSGHPARQWYRGEPDGWVLDGYWEGAIPGYWEGGIPGTAQLVLPAGYIGIARAQPAAGTRPQALRAPTGPSAHLLPAVPYIPASGPIKARFMVLYPKVSQNLGVSLNMVMRPAIVPISKRGP